jgi:hypothetical protein
MSRWPPVSDRSSSRCAATKAWARSSARSEHYPDGRTLYRDGYFGHHDAPDFTFIIDEVTDIAVTGSFGPTQFFYGTPTDWPVTATEGSFTLALQQ